MPWATFQQGDEYCNFKVDADGNKVGETLGCHPSKPAAQAQVAALYAAEKRSEKAGARHNVSDNSLIQKAHDALCELGATCKVPSGYGPLSESSKSTLSIFKDASGHYRWVTLSSSAFKDRDKEIVSTKALADDVARVDSDGEYGPLRWWHVPGADLGLADFNAMEGRVLVESGTFLDEAYGERLKDYADDLEISIGFTHPTDEPDSDGVYHHIKRFERSLVPTGKASNLLTQFSIKEGETMESEKESKLRQFLGPLADKVLGKAKEVQAVAEEKGVAFKAEETPPASEVKADAPKTIGSMSEDDLKAFVAKYTDAALAEVKALLTKNKENGDLAQVESLKAANELTTALKTIQESIATQSDAVKLALEGVAELKGELPRSQTKGYFRASEDGKEASDKFKAAGPQSDPLAPFMNALLNQSQ